ncbi:MAG: toll/interleukin-1 receptor domain-containing protein [Rubrivivax sp.]
MAPAPSPSGIRVFLSYAREDAVAAQSLVDWLRRHQCQVFWDQDMAPGIDWAEMLTLELDAAQCLIVLWTSASVQSQWVRNEADAALHLGKLWPLLLEPVAPPLAFRHLNAIDLSGWRGDGDDVRLERLLRALRKRFEADGVAALTAAGVSADHRKQPAGDAAGPTEPSATTPPVAFDDRTPAARPFWHWGALAALAFLLVLIAWAVLTRSPHGGGGEVDGPGGAASSAASAPPAASAASAASAPASEAASAANTPKPPPNLRPARCDRLLGEAQIRALRPDEQAFLRTQCR